MMVKHRCQGWCFRGPPSRGCSSGSVSAVASPADPSGHGEQGMTRVICPPGWPPAPAAILGASCQSFPGVTGTENFSPHQWHMHCLVPQTCATLRAGQARCLSGMCHGLEWHRTSPGSGHRLWLSGSWVGTKPSCCRGSTSLSWQESALPGNPALGSSDKGRLRKARGTQGL